MEGPGSYYERDSAVLEEEDDDDEMEEKAFTIRRSKSGSIRETLLYPVKQSPSVQALDNLVAEADEASTGESVERAVQGTSSLSLGPSPKAAHHQGLRPSSKLQLIACTGLECEVMDLRNGNIFLPPFAKTSVKFEWLERPRNVLVIIKPGEHATERALLETAGVLAENDITVYVETSVKEVMEKGKSNGQALAADLRAWVPGCVSIDFIVTLGGDGTVLWVSSLFPRGVPPVLSFAMGTLGFLTTFPFAEHRQRLGEVARGNQFLSLRTRMRCKLYSYNKAKGPNKTTTEGTKAKQRHHTTHTEELVGTYVVLNEVAVNRGPSSNLVDIDLFCDGVPVTKVQADGVLVSTPTGSTAYSLAAGGSVVHPAVSAMLLTPICPHSLSFRPLLFPDAVTLQLQIPHLSKSRGTCVVAFDGKHKFEMGPGDCVTIQMSPHPLPSVVCKTDTEDWFESLKGGLHWNRPNEEMRKPALNGGRSLSKKASSHL